MEANLANGWIVLAAPAVSAFFCLAAAIALGSLIRLNKGAKINVTWGLIAFGLTCFGLAAIDRTLELLDLPNAASVRHVLSAFASLLIAIGAVYGRGIYKNLLK